MNPGHEKSLPMLNALGEPHLGERTSGRARVANDFFAVDGNEFIELDFSNEESRVQLWELMRHE